MNEIEEIKKQLIISCINFNAQNFLPYLLSPQVQVDFPNKIRFYRLLKHILKTAKEETTGSLELRIESETWVKDKDLLAFNFYDEVHKYPRINLQVKEMEDKIFVDLKPF